MINIYIRFVDCECKDHAWDKDSCFITAEALVYALLHQYFVLILLSGLSFWFIIE